MEGRGGHFAVIVQQSLCLELLLICLQWHKSLWDRDFLAAEQSYLKSPLKYLDLDGNRAVSWLGPERCLRRAGTHKRDRLRRTPASGHVQDGKTPSDLGNVGDSLELTGGRHLRILL